MPEHRALVVDDIPSNRLLAAAFPNKPGRTGCQADDRHAALILANEKQ